MSDTKTFLILKYGDMNGALAAWLKTDKSIVDEVFAPEEQLAIAEYCRKRFANLRLTSIDEVFDQYGHLISDTD